jgi:signal transduction histidine kinase
VGRAQELTTKLLRMTRYQDNEKLCFEPFQNLSEIEDLLQTAVGKGIVLKINTEKNTQMIEANPSSFENAIINLCVNARDAMPDGGEIQIDVRLHHRFDNNYIAISVKDTGTGIPKEIQEKIFEPFFTTKESGKGSGLGLAQVQEFLKEIGGWLELDSNEKGTCFTLYFPEKLLEGNFQVA